MNYRITWEIDIHAASPLEAARQALAVQRDANSMATVFTVADEEGETLTIDLLEERGAGS